MSNNWLTTHVISEPMVSLRWDPWLIKDAFTLTFANVAVAHYSKINIIQNFSFKAQTGIK